MELKKRNRFFFVGKNKKIKIYEKAHISLEDDEQIVLLDENNEYDVVKKNWGFYSTPSINDRLKKNNFRTFLVINSFKKIYIMIVNEKKIKLFKSYLKQEKNKILLELTNGYRKKLL